MNRQERMDQREGETTEGAEPALCKGWNGCEEHQLQFIPITERNAGAADGNVVSEAAPK